MSDETLTAEETPEARALADFAWLRATNGGEKQGYPPIVRRLLAYYDAALARAEHNRGVAFVQADRADKAESRLAAVESVCDRLRCASGGVRASFIVEKLTEALSGSTPAPAVPVLGRPFLCPVCDDPLDSEHPKGPCVPCHELPDPAVPEARCTECENYRGLCPMCRPVASAAPEAPALPEGRCEEPDGACMSPADTCGSDRPCPLHDTPPQNLEGWVRIGHSWDVCWTDGIAEMQLSKLREYLATQGLSIIGAKDRAVLDALSDLDQGALEWITAELDRRKP